MKGECLEGPGSWGGVEDWSKQGKTKADYHDGDGEGDVYWNTFAPKLLNSFGPDL